MSERERDRAATGPGGGAGERPGAPWPLAVRLMSYGKFQAGALEHLRAIGVRHVFMAVPSPDRVDEELATLARCGLRPLVVRGAADLAREDFAGCLEGQLVACERMGVRHMFLSAKRGETPMAIARERLRAAGDAAGRRGVTITLETHPDLGTNGDVQVATMREVDHPNVRVNFDTGNITYYNRGASALAELRKSVGYVRTVEFKDHSGAFETWEFPVIGGGVVDFPGVIALLRGRGYEGPVTIEFEGVKGVDLDEGGTRAAIAESVARVRAMGDFE